MTTQYDVIIIGAGITGMTCAYQLTRKHKNVLVLERENRIGGQIHSWQIDGFTFESGPNTGVIKYPEVAELFEQLGESCTLETAKESSMFVLPSNPLHQHFYIAIITIGWIQEKVKVYI